MSSNFPSSQGVAALTIPSGTYSGYAFIVSDCHNGLGVVQLQPSSSDSTSYTPTILQNINATGSVNTALTFLPNPNSTPPYYFLLGAESGNLILYSITPSTSSFTSSNIVNVNTVASFNGAVVALLYYPALNTLYVAIANGDLWSYPVTWNGTTPSFGKGVENSTYSNASSGLITLTAASANNTAVLFVTGLTIGNQNGTFMFTAVPASQGALGTGTPIWYTNNSIATCISSSGVYTATSTGIVYNTFSSLSAHGLPIWNASMPSMAGQSIVSMAWCPNSNNAANGLFPDGALFIGTYATSTGTGSSSGSIYTYDPSNPSNQPNAWIESMTLGTPYSMSADQNMHVLVQSGSTGLCFYSVAFNSGMPQAAALIQQSVDSSSAWEGVLKCVEQVAYDFVKDVVSDVAEDAADSLVGALLA